VAVTRTHRAAAKRPAQVSAALAPTDAGSAPGTLSWSVACGALALAVAGAAVLLLRRRRRLND